MELIQTLDNAHAEAPNMTDDLRSRDIAHLIHPYTDARQHELDGPLVIDRGEGIYVYDSEGNRFIEGMAGLWSVAVGFSEPRLVEAAKRQLDRLPFYHLFGGKSHAPAIELAERLAQLAPKGLNHAFFTNSGSEANDTAVKLIWFYNNARGRPHKKKIISRHRAYHGVTVVSGSLTGLPGNHDGFDLPIPGMLHASCPHFWRNASPDESESEFSLRLATELEELILREGPENVAAFIGEPVMGAGGVIVPPQGYWQALQEVCRRHDVLLIADEVITGFGRTGRMFGSDTFAISPDVMVLSKQLTSSYMPLAAVMLSDEMYDVIADYSAHLKTLGHGFTGSGHPVAAAVALENLNVIRDKQLIEGVAEKGEIMQHALRQFAGHPLVGEVRGIGLIAAVELVSQKAEKKPFARPGVVGSYLIRRALAHGLIVRNLGDIIAFCPPLIIEHSQIRDMVSSFEIALHETWTWSRSISHTAI